MTSEFRTSSIQRRVLADYGFARARDLAFDAVRDLWDRRRSEGLTQANLAEKLGRDPAWVSRALKGPGNWTLRTFGELVAAMDGEIEVTVHGLEDSPPDIPNYSAYSKFDTSNVIPTRENLGSVLEKENSNTIYQNEKMRILEIDSAQFMPTSSIVNASKRWNY